MEFLKNIFIELGKEIIEDLKNHEDEEVRTTTNFLVDKFNEYYEWVEEDEA